MSAFISSWPGMMVESFLSASVSGVIIFQVPEYGVPSQAFEVAPKLSNEAGMLACSTNRVLREADETEIISKFDHKAVSLIPSAIKVSPFIVFVASTTLFVLSFWTNETCLLMCFSFLPFSTDKVNSNTSKLSLPGREIFFWSYISVGVPFIFQFSITESSFVMAAGEAVNEVILGAHEYKIRTKNSHRDLSVVNDIFWLIFIL